MTYWDEEEWARQDRRVRLVKRLANASILAVCFFFVLYVLEELTK